MIPVTSYLAFDIVQQYKGKRYTRNVIVSIDFKRNASWSFSNIDSQAGFCDSSTILYDTKKKKKQQN